MEENRINVTQPLLPSLDEFIPMLEDIWRSKWLTNNGKYHQALEKALQEYLGVPYISLFANGTLALITALQCLRITGEVITTPYSFVATTHALHWNKIKPVFCDIDADYLNIDPAKLESLITPATTAIMPVHVYGNPCEVNKIEEIADSYGLKVIYDAAHAFGVTRGGESILNYGDLSILSFHATKVFNTIEGGAIVCKSARIKKRIDYLKNFGFANETSVVGPGINAKMNEIQAAYGLLQLQNIDKAIERRKEIVGFYSERLKDIEGISFLSDIEGVRHNYSYFPVFIDKDKFGITRDEVYEELLLHNIYARRYFYPLISQFPTYKGLDSARQGCMPIAEKVAEEVICLPVYPALENKDLERIVKVLKGLKIGKCFYS
jgi:dTDP-4-amino-4,6-dideoxygalactose transaminase